MDRMDSLPELNLAHIVRPASQSDKASLAAENGTPGLLLLHGRGADEEDLMGLEAALDPRLTIVSARAPFKLGPGFAWYDMAQIGSPDEDTFTTALSELRGFVDGLPAAYGIDPQRLFLMGFSQGAIMSAALALTVPHKVRGVIMHSGYVPISTGLEVVPGGIEGKGFFVAHGLYDEVIPVIYGRQSEAYLSLHKALLIYREYPIGHSISEESLYDLSEWLSREMDD